ncbi:DUF2911 domain-containing protein [Gillisia sp. M10.2A]|uniref:DUF2911 domain-containing protein n=1 Tax=Gillisia lutea TaxID=2909668 RepID=A0ABS9EHG7_9FLAO|nr:DUF2911 domain-containing protein [Gillisia lutea]MCF4102319.1 DUF2911 domain-containing protein [Gillisia lutea]
MKRILLIALIVGASIQHNTLKAQTTEGLNFAKLDASPMDLAIYKNADNKVVARVIYSRPQKRNREIFGKLVPYGEVWRTGANESTELTLYKDMMVAGVKVNAGTYTMYSIPEENEWTVILNNSTFTWGAYEYTDKQDIVRIKVPVKKSPTSIESFSIAFVAKEDGADLLMGWDDRYVEVPFKTVIK